LDDIYSDVEYVTRDEIILAQGTSIVSGYAVSLDERYLPSLPRGMVRGLQGFSTISCTNEDDGTHGRDIEDDDTFRDRIILANRLAVGTRETIETYLDSYTGLDDYKLVPLYDGVGTLLIVCDTVESLLPTIRDDVYHNCMGITDLPPECILPQSTTLNSLTVSITIGPTGTGNLTLEEFISLVSQQVRIFVDGGTRRKGGSYKGLGIGEDFVPSMLIKYLFGEFPELVDVVPSSLDVVSVDDDSKFILENLEVVVL